MLESLLFFREAGSFLKLADFMEVACRFHQGESPLLPCFYSQALSVLTLLISELFVSPPPPPPAPELELLGCSGLGLLEKVLP